MIDPTELLKHAKELVPTGRGRPPNAALRRGISAAYYAIFHYLTEYAARHLIGSCPQEIQNEIRRSWSHGEISQLATTVMERATTLQHAPAAGVPANLEKLGPLLDVAAKDGALVDSLRLFNDLQEQRHSADYDHGAKFAKGDLVQACASACLARKRLRNAAPAAREAFFTLLTLGRKDFRRR